MRRRPSRSESAPAGVDSSAYTTLNAKKISGIAVTGRPRFFARRIRKASEELPTAKTVATRVKSIKGRPSPAKESRSRRAAPGRRGTSRRKSTATRMAIAPGTVAIQTTAGPAATPLAEPIDKPHRQHMRPGSRHRQQRLRQVRECVSGDDQRFAPPGAVGEPPGKDAQDARRALRHALVQADRGDGRTQRHREEERQHRDDHLRGDVGEETDQPGGEDVAADDPAAGGEDNGSASRVGGS